MYVNAQLDIHMHPQKQKFAIIIIIDFFNSLKAWKKPTE